MKHIKTFENFTPIVIKNKKPYKVKKNIPTSIQFLQRRIKSLRKRLDDQYMGTPKKGQRNRLDMNKDKNDKIQKLKDLQFKQLQQAEYLKNNSVQEGRENYKTLKYYWIIPCDDRLEDALVKLVKAATHYDNIVEPIDKALGFAKGLREKLKKEDFVYFRADIVADFKEDRIINSGFDWCYFTDIYKKDLEKMGYVYAGEINTTPEEIQLKLNSNDYNL